MKNLTFKKFTLTKSVVLKFNNKLSKPNQFKIELTDLIVNLGEGAPTIVTGTKGGKHGN